MRHGSVLVRSENFPLFFSNKILILCHPPVCSPSGSYMATGTMAGAVDLSFSTTACLEVRRPDRGSFLRRARARPHRPRAFCRCSSWIFRGRSASFRSQAALSRRASGSTGFPGVRPEARRRRFRYGLRYAVDPLHRQALSAHHPGHSQLGLIAGGLVDGTVNLWNPAKIIGTPLTEEPSDGSSSCLVTSLQKHAGAVRTVIRGPAP